MIMPEKEHLLQELNTKSNPKICIVTTIDASLDGLFPEFYPLLIANGYDVVGICADTSDGLRSENVRKQGVRVINVPMTREFTIWQDVKCLWALYHIFKREKFDIIHYSTAKASLLAAIDGRLVGGSFLLYTLRGLGYMAVSGPKRAISRLCEKITCLATHHTIAISESLATEAIRQNLLPENKIEVHGAGSSKGVNIERFCPNDDTIANSKRIRHQLGINDDNIVIGFAGRLTTEKGIEELLKAFLNLNQKYSNLYLLIIGDQDQRNPLNPDAFDIIMKTGNIHLTGYTNDMPSYLAAVDIFTLPSYREGFGNVIIEASAMGIPVITTDILGCKDAVVEDKTGLKVKVRDVASLEKALDRLIANPNERDRMGQNGRQWVIENFDRKIIWSRLIAIYEQILNQRKE
jgi:glycosyltransferase involved in cell wall biosynthesis